MSYPLNKSTRDVHSLLLPLIAHFNEFMVSSFIIIEQHRSHFDDDDDDVDDVVVEYLVLL